MTEFEDGSHLPAPPPPADAVLGRSIAWGTGAGVALGPAVVALTILWQTRTISELAPALLGFLILGPVGAFVGAPIGLAEGVVAGMMLEFGRGWIGSSARRAAGLAALGTTIGPVLVCLCVRTAFATLWCLVFAVLAAIVGAVLAPQIACRRSGGPAPRTVVGGASGPSHLL